MQCNTEEQAVALVKTLPPMQAALLDWGINLMADVVQEEHFNKMNAHNIAMVFAPNMTQVSHEIFVLTSILFPKIPLADKIIPICRCQIR